LPPAPLDRRHLEIDPSHAAARFWLAACSAGADRDAEAAAAAAGCPREMVAGLFDGYAEKFDSHLVGALQYRTPQLLW
jgi:predicted TPR repeat methyltransferase